MQIALITEGITDKPIIDASLYAYCSINRISDCITTSLLPENKESVGWFKVLEYCTTDRFRNAFDFNDYVIIQIDADAHLNKGFDVPKQENANALIEAIKSRIIQSIGNDFYEQNQTKIIFAISVNQIECWLLPFYANKDAHKKKEINCCDTVNQYLKKIGYTLDCTNDAGGFNQYQRAAKIIADKKVFFPHYKHNESLKYFVENELSKIK